MWRSWKQVSRPSAWNFDRSGNTIIEPPWRCAPRPARGALAFASTVRCSLDARFQRGDELIEPRIAHEADHLAVVDQQHRRIGAGTEALALLHRDQAVGAGTALLDAELAAQMLQRVLAIAQLA